MPAISENLYNAGKKIKANRGENFEKYKIHSAKKETIMQIFVVEHTTQL